MKKIFLCVVCALGVLLTACGKSGNDPIYVPNIPHSTINTESSTPPSTNTTAQSKIKITVDPDITSLDEDNVLKSYSIMPDIFSIPVNEIKDNQVFDNVTDIESFFNEYKKLRNAQLSFLYQYSELHKKDCLSLKVAPNENPEDAVTSVGVENGIAFVVYTDLINNVREIAVSDVKIVGNKAYLTLSRDPILEQTLENNNRHPYTAIFGIISCNVELSEIQFVPTDEVLK